MDPVLHIEPAQDSTTSQIVTARHHAHADSRGVVEGHGYRPTIHPAWHGLFTRAGALGFVFEQVPGELTFDSPMVVVTECDPRAMAVAVVQAMPDVEAGRLPDIPIVTDPVEHIAPTWSANSVWDDVESRPVYRTQRFFEQRADLTGVITVAQGRSKFGPRGLHETTLLWRDVADDGRYVMALDDSPVAVATSRQQLVYRIHRDIEHLLERIESHWEDGRPEDQY